MAVNTYVVYNEETKKGIVIDPSFNPQVIIDCINQEELEIEAILLTHGHFDHIAGVDAVRKQFGVPVYIHADGRQLYRAIENLYANAAKYAMENTTIYVELMPLDKIVVFTIKNIMDTRLQIAKNSYEDLTERFVRGEVSRTTEGSGLGLSIAKSLTTLMGGTFHIMVDKDTFTARITFPLANNN
jgi:signal transduction histidine kinase